MRKTQLLSLDFFAQRFGFYEKELSYGIAKINDKTIPVILVKDKPVFINIPEDILYPKDLPNLEIVFEECTFLQSENEYVFKTSEPIAKFTRQEIEEFYACKYYTEDTKKYLY